MTEDTRDLSSDYAECEQTDCYGRTSDDFDTDCGDYCMATTAELRALFYAEIDRELARRSWRAEDSWQCWRG